MEDDFSEFYNWCDTVIYKYTSETKAAALIAKKLSEMYESYAEDEELILTELSYSGHSADELEIECNHGNIIFFREGRWGWALTNRYAKAARETEEARTGPKLAIKYLTLRNTEYVFVTYATSLQRKGAHLSCLVDNDPDDYRNARGILAHRVSIIPERIIQITEFN